MLVLRYAALLALVVWVGGLVALGGIAAPSVFDVIAERQLADGRVLSGALFGEMLARFTILSYLSGGALLLTLILRRILGPRPHRFAWRAGITAVMLAASAYGSIRIAGRIGQLQREIGAAPSSLSEGDPRRVEFGRLHGISTALQLVPLLGGLMLIYWEIKE
ncbi:MAG TPA: DUF4149 domain-containing protein [Vicinamibacterales bacterium]|nr:DUF4149 domain-containing protein [Vicinamibacterales bacterium]